MHISGCHAGLCSVRSERHLGGGGGVRGGAVGTAGALARSGAVVHVLLGVRGDAAALPVLYHARHLLLRLPLLLLTIIIIPFLQGTTTQPKLFWS